MEGVARPVVLRPESILGNLERSLAPPDPVLGEVVMLLTHLRLCRPYGTRHIAAATRPLRAGLSYSAPSGLQDRRGACPHVIIGDPKITGLRRCTRRRAPTTTPIAIPRCSSSW